MHGLKKQGGGGQAKRMREAGRKTRGGEQAVAAKLSCSLEAGRKRGTDSLGGARKENANGTFRKGGKALVQRFYVVVLQHKAVKRKAAQSSSQRVFKHIFKNILEQLVAPLHQKADFIGREQAAKAGLDIQRL